jgi:hypothetical protein
LDFDHDKIEGMIDVNGLVTYSNDSDFSLNGSIPKVITGSFPVGVYPANASGGLVIDYTQLLSVDPQRLQSTVGTVNVTVNPDTAPTIGTVANQVVAVGATTAAIAVTVGDAETPVGSLVLSATSSNPALVPAADIVLGGSGANRTITVGTATGPVATATITLTVDDTVGMTTTTSFTVTTDNAPMANNGTLSATAGVTALGNLSASDPEGQAVTYRVVGAPGKGSVGVIVATGAYGYIANPGASGTDTFTFVASDGYLDSAPATVTITIAPGAGTATTTTGGTATAGTGSAGTTTVGTSGAVSTGSSNKSCGLGSGLAALLSLLIGLRVGRRRRAG